MKVNGRDEDTPLNPEQELEQFLNGQTISTDAEEAPFLEKKDLDSDKTNLHVQKDQHTDQDRSIKLDLDEDDTDYDSGRFSKFIERIEDAVSFLVSKCQTQVNFGIKTAIFLAYLVYFSYCMSLSSGDEDSIMLIVITCIVILVVIRKLLTARGLECSLPVVMKDCLSSTKAKKIRRFFRYGLYFITMVGFATFLGVEVLQHHTQNLQSLFGMFGLVLVSFMCSVKPSKVNWHPVFWGCAIQFGFASLTLKTQVGYDLFAWMGRSVEDFINFSDAGAAFVLGKNFEHMGLAFALAGVIIFFNSVMFLLTHWGVIEFIVIRLGYILSLCMETGPVESVVATANIFVGLSEAPLLIRPYLPTVTKSEIHTIMTCGFASIAGSTMGLFIRFGAPANHLLTAAVISAPAALAMSKLIYPETTKVDYSKQRDIKMKDSNDKQNALSAAADGSVMALTLLGAIMANMVAFYSLLYMMNTFLTWFGQRANYEGLTFELICSWILFPVAFLMGVETDDCGRVGALIGTKLFATPMVAYAQLGVMRHNRVELEDYMLSDNGTWYWKGQDIILDGLNKTLQYGIMSERSEVIATYAMCGFSAFTSIGICIGALSSICPPRKRDVVELVFRAFLAGNMASFLTGAVAGVMYSGQ